MSLFVILGLDQSIIVYVKVILYAFIVSFMLSASLWTRTKLRHTLNHHTIVMLFERYCFNNPLLWWQAVVTYYEFRKRAIEEIDQVINFVVKFELFSFNFKDLCIILITDIQSIFRWKINLKFDLMRGMFGSHSHSSPKISI